MGIEKIQENIGAPATGKWDKETVEQTIKFQKKYNLPETGLPDAKLKKVIQSLLDRKMKAKKRKQQSVRHPKLR